MALEKPSAKAASKQPAAGSEAMAASPVLGSATPPSAPVPSVLANTKSPMEEFLEEWKEKGRDNVQFLHQWRLILRNPKIILEATPANILGWRTPMTFAVQMIAAVALLVSGVHFAATHIPGTPITTDDQPPTATEQKLEKDRALIQQISSYDPSLPVTLFFDQGSRVYSHTEALDVVQKEADELQRRVTIEKDTAAFVLWVFTYLQPVFVGLALVLSSSFFRKGLVRKFGNAGNASVADRCYLYISSARTFWAAVFLNIMLLAWQWIHYGNQSDPVLEAFFASTILCIAFSLLARWRMTRDLSAVLDFPDAKKAKKEVATQIGLSGMKALFLVGVCQWGLAFIVRSATASILKRIV